MRILSALVPIALTLAAPRLSKAQIHLNNETVKIEADTAKPSPQPDPYINELLARYKNAQTLPNSNYDKVNFDAGLLRDAATVLRAPEFIKATNSAYGDMTSSFQAAQDFLEIAHNKLPQQLLEDSNLKNPEFIGQLFNETASSFVNSGQLEFTLGINPKKDRQLKPFVYPNDMQIDHDGNIRFDMHNGKGLIAKAMRLTFIKDQEDQKTRKFPLISGGHPKKNIPDGVMYFLEMLSTASKKLREQGYGSLIGPNITQIIKAFDNGAPVIINSREKGKPPIAPISGKNLLTPKQSIATRPTKKAEGPPPPKDEAASALKAHLEEAKQNPRNLDKETLAFLTLINPAEMNKVSNEYWNTTEKLALKTFEKESAKATVQAWKDKYTVPEHMSSLNAKDQVRVLLDTNRPYVAKNYNKIIDDWTSFKSKKIEPLLQKTVLRALNTALKKLDGSITKLDILKAADSSGLIKTLGFKPKSGA